MYPSCGTDHQGNRGARRDARRDVTSRQTEARAGAVDLDSTIVVDGGLVKIRTWYNSEWAYAAQMVRQAKTMATK